MAVLKQFFNLILRHVISRYARETGVDAKVLRHLQHASPSFTACKKGRGLLRRFKVSIHAVDSTANLPKDFREEVSAGPLAATVLRT